MSFDRLIAVDVNLDAASVGRTAFGVPLIMTALATGDYAITAVSVPASTFGIAGDHAAAFKQGEVFRVYGSTGNDRTFTCSIDSTFGAGTTTITVVETIASAVVDGYILEPDFAGFYKLYSYPSEVAADQDFFGVAADVDEICQAFAQNPRPKQIAVGVWGTGHATISEALDDLFEVWRGFYCFAVKDALAASLVATPNTGTASAWAETNKRLLFAGSDNALIPNSAVETTSIAYLAESLALEYTLVFYHPTVAEMAAWSLAAKYFAFNPDSYATIAYCQTLTGVTAQNYNSTQQTNMNTKRANYYTTMGGVGAVGMGYTAASRWLDVRVAADWLGARVHEELMQAFVNASNAGRKIPYTDAGFAILGAKTKGVLQRGEGIGHFVEGSSAVDMPALADIPQADRDARLLRFRFGTQPSGAVQEVEIIGTVSTSFTAS